MNTQYIATICESESFIFEGVQIYIWDKLFSITDEKIEVVDPIYHQKYLFNIWKVSVGDKTINFAIGEFSNSVYGVFYLYEERDRNSNF